MKHYRMKVAAAVAGIVAFFFLLGIAGDIDFTEQVILNMSFEEYDSIKALLSKQKGHEPSERDIAHWWVEHHRDN